MKAFLILSTKFLSTAWRYSAWITPMSTLCCRRLRSSSGGDPSDHRRDPRQLEAPVNRDLPAAPLQPHTGSIRRVLNRLRGRRSAYSHGYLRRGRGPDGRRVERSPVSSDQEKRTHGSAVHSG